jgi:hypothetical protein
LARRLPHLSIIAVCSSVQASRSALFTLEMCVPIPRWIPEHRIHINTPSDQDAHRGCVATWQSAHTLFSGRFSNSYSQRQYSPPNILSIWQHSYPSPTVVVSVYWPFSFSLQPLTQSIASLPLLFLPWCGRFLSVV